MDIGLIVNITSRAWALPILASFHAGVPGRQARLLAATGASRTAFGQSLEHLLAIGLVERNPGHGHPLRPEFRLTPMGQQVAAIAYKIHNLTEEDERPLLRKTWTLPVLASLYYPRYFNEIGRAVGSITDRALSHSLQSMEARCWVRRNIDEEARPPRPVYSAINTGETICRAAAQFGPSGGDVGRRP